MRFGCWSLLLVPVALLIIAHFVAHDPREETLALERFAHKVERANAITPEAEHVIRQAVQSIRRKGPQRDGQLEARQRLAVDRIEAVLQSYVGALSPTQGTARRNSDTIHVERVNN